MTRELQGTFGLSYFEPDETRPGREGYTATLHLLDHTCVRTELNRTAHDALHSAVDLLISEMAHQWFEDHADVKGV